MISPPEFSRRRRRYPCIRLARAYVLQEGEGEGFGEKDISFFGGFTLLANNITGPGTESRLWLLTSYPCIAMVAIPLCYQQAGFLTYVKPSPR